MFRYKFSSVKYPKPTPKEWEYAGAVQQVLTQFKNSWSFFTSFKNSYKTDQRTKELNERFHIQVDSTAITVGIKDQKYSSGRILLFNFFFFLIFMQSMTPSVLSSNLSRTKYLDTMRLNSNRVNDYSELKCSFWCRKSLQYMDGL